MPRRASHPNHIDELQAIARAAMLIDQYSLQITALVDRVLGVESAGNHEVQVLSSLFDKPGQRPPDLVNLTGLSRAGVAALIARLEQIGLVERTHGQRDRRTMLVFLTRTGRRRLAELGEALEDLFMSSAPTVREILDLLGHTSRPHRGPDDTSLVLAGRISAAGARYARRLDEVSVGGLRPRLALTTMTAVDNIRPTRLAEILGLSSGGLTYLVDQLEEGGLAERAYGVVADDRRAVVIRLTDEGLTAGRALCTVLTEHADSLGTVLSATLAPKPPATSLRVSTRRPTTRPAS